MAYKMPLVGASTASVHFTFSIEFKALPARKAAACFRHVFGIEPPAALGALSGLVPADFGIVRRRAEILGGLDDPAALVAMLRGELAKRGEGAAAQMGFRLVPEPGKRGGASTVTEK